MNNAISCLRTLPALKEKGLSLSALLFQDVVWPGASMFVRIEVTSLRRLTLRNPLACALNAWAASSQFLVAVCRTNDFAGWGKNWQIELPRSTRPADELAALCPCAEVPVDVRVAVKRGLSSEDSSDWVHRRKQLFSPALLRTRLENKSYAARPCDNAAVSSDNYGGNWIEAEGQDSLYPLLLV